MKKTSMSVKKNCRLWSSLRVLCCSGLDAMSIAPDAFTIVHELVPNAASALFLTSHDGVPEATFHEDCPAHVQELCLRETALFEGLGEINTPQMVTNPNTPKIGQLLAPPREYFRAIPINFWCAAVATNTRSTPASRLAAGATASSYCSASPA